MLEHRSLNGFLLSELGRVPEAGESVDYGGVTVHILEATDTQVTRARIRRSSPPPIDTAGEPPEARATG